MKKIIVLIFVIFSFSISAQEKQNDATLKETILWLRNYGIPRSEQEGEKWFIYFDEQSNLIKYTIKIGKEREEFISTDKDTQDLEFFMYEGKYIINVPMGHQAYPFSYGVDKDFALRVFKAFEHLYYLLKWDVKCENLTVSENKF
ncbi:hypothetical protein [Aequorivita nionensis]|uniref:hypothetical protein n=1 Tax=Aequorivita nionensis TaxID=1287690 RepID=UPI003965CC72